MLLHAWRLRFTHPASGTPMAIEAPLDAAYRALLARFGWIAQDPGCNVAAAAGGGRFSFMSLP
jgi:hypothetical protein